MKKIGCFVFSMLCLLQVFQLFSIKNNSKCAWCCLAFWKKKTIRSSNDLEEMIVISTIPALVIPKPPSIESIHTCAPKSRSADSLDSFVRVEYNDELHSEDDNDSRVYSPKGMARTGSYVSSTTAEIQHSSGTFRKSTSVEMNNNIILTDQGWLTIEDDES